ncbi:MAG: mechanosensitive ion channel domain-containing protein [Dysgonomonas sp.]
MAEILSSIHDYLPQVIMTLFVIVITPISKIISRKLIRQYGLISRKVESRVNHIIRIIAILINITCLITIVIIWGVNPRNIFVALSSIFAVIGVAFFAQWSILSNVTAGILIFFTSPFHIGDFIRIHDKETPIEAEVIDILTFHIHFKTRDGEIIVYPNSLLLQKGISVINKNDKPGEPMT